MLPVLRKNQATKTGTAPVTFRSDALEYLGFKKHLRHLSSPRCDVPSSIRAPLSKYLISYSGHTVV